MIDCPQDVTECALIVARACWPDVAWSAQNAGYLVGKLPDEKVRRDFDWGNFTHVREAEDIAIERGLEFRYGRCLHDELPHEEGKHHAGVQWTRAPFHARVRALARAFLEAPRRASRWTK